MHGFTTNFHTHTARCKHATGTDREMVQAALDAGVQVLGIADHTPYPGAEVQHMRMAPEEAAGYFASLTALRTEFAGRIDLHIGFEAEYFPDCFDQLRRFLEDYPCEYLILGQHFSSARGEIYYGMPCDDVSVLARYVDLAIAGMETGLFAYLAHPDLCRLRGDQSPARPHYLRLCQAAKELGLPLEVNLLGFRDRRGYPSENFFHIAQEVGNTLILGADAHSPAHFADPAVLQACTDWAAQFGLPIVHEIPFRSMLRQK